MIVTSADGEKLENIIGVAFPVKLACFQVMTVLVTVTGIVIGIAGAFILGEIAGWLIDLIIGSGGSAPLSTDGHRCYVGSCLLARLGTSNRTQGQSTSLINPKN